MEHLKMSKMPLNDMDKMQKEEMNSEMIMPEINVSVDKFGVEGRMSPVSDKPLRDEKSEWMNG